MRRIPKKLHNFELLNKCKKAAMLNMRKDAKCLVLLLEGEHKAILYPRKFREFRVPAMVMTFGLFTLLYAVWERIVIVEEKNNVFVLFFRNISKTIKNYFKT